MWGRVVVEADNADDAAEAAEQMAREGRIKFELEADPSELLPGSDFGVSTVGAFEVGDSVEATMLIKSHCTEAHPNGIPAGTPGRIAEIDTRGSTPLLQVEFEGHRGYTPVSTSKVKKT